MSQQERQGGFGPSYRRVAFSFEKTTETTRTTEKVVGVESEVGTPVQSPISALEENRSENVPLLNKGVRRTRITNAAEAGLGKPKKTERKKTPRQTEMHVESLKRKTEKSELSARKSRKESGKSATKAKNFAKDSQSTAKRSEKSAVKSKKEAAKSKASAGRSEDALTQVEATANQIKLGLLQQLHDTLHSSVEKRKRLEPAIQKSIKRHEKKIAKRLGLEKENNRKFKRIKREVRKVEKRLGTRIDNVQTTPGPQGKEGPQGPEGSMGNQGNTGAPGESAYKISVANGYAGTEKQWLDSLKGKDGKSAYQLAVDAGFQGDEAAWLASLKGAKGEGVRGADGLQGIRGEKPKFAWMPGAVIAGILGTIAIIIAMNAGDGKTTIIQQQGLPERIEADRINADKIVVDGTAVPTITK